MRKRKNGTEFIISAGNYKTICYDGDGLCDRKSRAFEVFRQ